MDQRFGRQDRKKHPIKAGKRKKNLNNEDSLRDLWDMKRSNIHIIRVREEGREQGIMTENYPGEGK